MKRKRRKEKKEKKRDTKERKTTGRHQDFYATMSGFPISFPLGEPFISLGGGIINLMWPGPINYPKDHHKEMVHQRKIGNQTRLLSLGHLFICFSFQLMIVAVVCFLFHHEKLNEKKTTATINGKEKQKDDQEPPTLFPFFFIFFNFSTGLKTRN